VSLPQGQRCPCPLSHHLGATAIVAPCPAAVGPSCPCRPPCGCPPLSRTCPGVHATLIALLVHPPVIEDMPCCMLPSQTLGLGVAVISMSLPPSRTCQDLCCAPPQHRRCHRDMLTAPQRGACRHPCTISSRNSQLSLSALPVEVEMEVEVEGRSCLASALHPLPLCMPGTLEMQ
jgi:hypothetical protein